jgi:hypothetical protein
MELYQHDEMCKMYQEQTTFCGKKCNKPSSELLPSNASWRVWQMKAYSATTDQLNVKCSEQKMISLNVCEGTVL